MIECDYCGKVVENSEIMELGKRNPPYYDVLYFCKDCYYKHKGEERYKRCQRLNKKQSKSDD